MVTAARIERERFADTLAEFGPDAPTLCDPWTTRDLAAHVVLRDSRPDAMPGVLIDKLAGYTEKVQDRIAARAWDDIVDDVRTGPPVWSPTRLSSLERLMNTTEFFVHHEDVRRAESGWAPRDLDTDLVDDLHGALRRSAKLFTRKAPAGITLHPDGRPAIRANDDQPLVTVSGPVGELVLWIFGRQAHAKVAYSGEPAAIDALRRASFGI